MGGARVLAFWELFCHLWVKHSVGGQRCDDIIILYFSLGGVVGPIRKIFYTIGRMDLVHIGHDTCSLTGEILSVVF